MDRYISFDAYGDNFLPSTIDYPFSKSCDPGTLDPKGRYKYEPRPYGLAEVRVPSHIPDKDRIAYIVRIALALLPEIKRAGATEWEIWILRFYVGQCDEVYTPEDLALLAQLGCPVLYTADPVSAEEEIELAKEMETSEKDANADR